MPATSSFWKLKREELKRRRTTVMSEHDLKPDDPILVSKLAIIDEEIGYCTKKIESTAFPLCKTDK